MMRQRKMRKGEVAGVAKLEQLERRQLLSAALDGNILRILTGTRSDVINITMNGSNLQVQESGASSTFDWSAIAKIRIETGAGNDLVQAAGVSLPIEAYLGSGADSLFSGSGNDLVYGGSGADLISTGDGADAIYGDSGDDRIIAGVGRDTITGGLGSDAINTGSNGDVVYDTGRNVDRGRGAIYNPMSTLVSYEPGVFQESVTGYDPNQIRQAYGFGDYDPNAGAGQTIYIVDAFTGLNIQDDFTAFCEQFGLPVPTASNFRIVNAAGRAPAIDSGWAMEIMLDLQWARAIAPAAKIVLVQADSNISNDLYLAVKKAANMAQSAGGGVVSMSFGRNYIYDPTDPTYSPATTADMYLWDNLFRARTKVTFLASSGDDGDSNVASWPAMSPYVTSVGGTVLTLDQDGNPIDEEVAWIGGGSGYGLPDWYERPTYQDGVDYSLPDPNWLPVTRGIAADEDVRGLPDVSYNADFYAVYTTTPFDGDSGWFSVGGTSAGTPQWAAIVALANQKRKAIGQPVIGNKLNGMLYDIYNGYAAQSGSNRDYTDCFNDIMVGQAGPWVADYRYDMASGIGTPKAENLIDTMSDYAPFFLQKSFTFESRLFMPFSVARFGLTPVSSGQERSGTGSIVGTDALNLTFLTDPVGLYGPGFTPVTVADQYYDVEEGQASAFRVQLYRSGRGQTSGRIYGMGEADIVNADPRVLFGTATFTLRFDGTWWTGRDGQTHFNINFGAVDPVTYEPLPSKPGELVAQPGLPSLGAYYSGHITG